MQINIQLNADYVYDFGRNIDNYHFRWVMGQCFVSIDRRNSFARSLEVYNHISSLQA